MKLHRNEKFVKWGLTAFVVFAACALFWIVFSNLPGFYAVVQKFIDIIAPLLYGCLFAYLMNPLMKWSMKLLKKWFAKSKKPRSERKVEAWCTGISVVFTVLVFLLMVVAFFALVVPSLITSAKDLLSKIQIYYETIVIWVEKLLLDLGIGDWQQIEQWLNENYNKLIQFASDAIMRMDFGSILSGVTSSVSSIVMGVFNAVVGVIAAVYILIYKKQLCAQTKKIVVSLFPTTRANRIFEVSRRTNRIFGGYVIGKLLDAAFVGVVTYIALLIMKMPYAPLIAVIVGVTNIIPFFGPFIGAIPSAFLLLIDKPINAVYFVIFIIVLQMVDGYIVENRILGEKLGISDLWVLAAILVFGGVFGFAGMLLGVPVFAVIYSLISDGVDRRLTKKRYPLETGMYYSLQNVEDLPVEPAPSNSFISVEPSYDMKIEPEDEDYEEEEE